MALTVGELAVQLEAQTRDFQRKLDAVRGDIRTFETRVNRSTKRAGLSFRSLIGPIAAVAAALATIGVTRRFAGLAKSAIQTAAAFESYEVRLKALLGSQGEANKALQRFIDLSSRTPYAVSQVVGGATTLASIVRGNREELEELTLVAANLAAVTGLSFQQAAENLQRALASGIGAADLFRERGVRQLIESVTQIPDLTKVPLRELRRAFEDAFGRLGKFGTAAQDLSSTLGGALSNIGDAVERFRYALGKALSPAVVAAAKGVIIPFFDDLARKIEENEDVLARFFVEAFAKAAEAIARLIRAVGPLIAAVAEGITKALELANEIHELFIGLVVTFDRLRLGVQVLETGMNAIGAALRVIAFMIGTRTREEVEEQMDALDQSVAKTVKLAMEIHDGIRQEAEKNKPAMDEHEAYFERLASKAEGAAGAIRRIGEEQIRAAQARAGAPGGVGAAPPPPELDIEALKKARQLRENREEVARAEERFRAIIAGSFEVPNERLEAIGEALGQSVRGNLEWALDDILAGEVPDFAEMFASISSDLFREAMSETLDNLASAASGLFQDLAGGLGGMFGEGADLGGIGQALGAGLAIGGSLIAKELEGTSTTISNELARSAVTSTQQVRGLVAGPANIPIAEVGNAIRDAMAGQLGELRRGNTLLGAILEAIRAIDLGAYAGGEALADLIASEFNGSVALG